MKLLELHILQSFPVSCLNRDDVGSPKTAVFGGANRARISSQCLKRAIREHARQNFPNACFNGQRTRLIVEPLKQALQKHGMDDKEVDTYAKGIADLLAGFDEGKTKVLLFLSPSEIDTLANNLILITKEKSEKDKLDKILEDKKKSKDQKDKKDTENKKSAKEEREILKKLKKNLDSSDATDIAIFGRMVANDSSLTLEGAGMFSHALSTHYAENEIDFFSAVDDRKTLEDDSGAAMLGSLEYNSAVYYRYAALNLDLLFQDTHLGKLAPQERKNLVDAFIRSTLIAVPKARQNSMNANTLPAFVLGTIKEKGQPIQLINAFEEPVRATNGSGLIEESVNRLKSHNDDLKKIWGIETVFEAILQEKNLNVFCSEMINHVQ